MNFLRRLVSDPPPRFVAEISEAGLAFAHIADGPRIGFEPLAEGVIAVSPVRDNVLEKSALAARVQAVAPRADKKRQRAAVILPDYSVRISVIDFDSFPSEPQQQAALVKFRIKKSLPFEIDSASVSYYPQPDGGTKSLDVVVAVAPLEILAHYEMPFRAAGFHPGLITTSALAAIQMAPADRIVLVAKLSGRVLTLAALDRGALKLLRSLELTGGGVEEIASHLYPTFAFMEDELGGRPEEVFTCGFGPTLNSELAAEIQLPCTPLRSRYGAPDQFNAGLLGFLESMEELQ